MQNTSDDMLMALADDELDGPVAEALRLRIESDPVLAARFAVFSETRAALQAAYEPGETPSHVIASIRAMPVGASPSVETVVPFRPRRAGLTLIPIAASILLAVGVGGFLVGRTFSSETTADPGVLAAEALEGVGTGAETALAGGGTARVLGSYDTTEGLCRLVDLDLPSGLAERAVVCRDSDSEWVVVAAIAAGQSEAYIPASDTAAALIDQVLDDLSAGPPLDPASEAKVLAR